MFFCGFCFLLPIHCHWALGWHVGHNRIDSGSDELDHAWAVSLRHSCTLLRTQSSVKQDWYEQHGPLFVLFSLAKFRSSPSSVVSHTVSASNVEFLVERETVGENIGHHLWWLLPTCMARPVRHLLAPRNILCESWVVSSRCHPRRAQSSRCRGTNFSPSTELNSSFRSLATPLLYAIFPSNAILIIFKSKLSSTVDWCVNQFTASLQVNRYSVRSHYDGFSGAWEKSNLMKSCRNLRFIFSFLLILDLIRGELHWWLPIVAGNSHHLNVR